LEWFFENYSTNIYEAIIKSISQWLPPFAKSEGKEALQYFEKVLKNTLSNAVEAIQRKIESDSEENFNAEKIELSNLHLTEIEKLKIEIANLKEENKTLRNAKPLVEYVSPIEESIHEISDKKKDFEEPKKVSVVAEPEINISDDYDSMSLADLKKVAKERKIKDYSKINDKEDIIRLIRKRPSLLL
jgi:glutamyl/glutaminyl-tRNA synthetase